MARPLSRRFVDGGVNDFCSGLTVLYGERAPLPPGCAELRGKDNRFLSKSAQSGVSAPGPGEPQAEISEPAGLTSTPVDRAVPSPLPFNWLPCIFIFFHYLLLLPAYSSQQAGSQATAVACDWPSFLSV